MKKNIKKYNIEDILVILALITPGFSNLNGLLPLNLSQIIMILLFVIILLRKLKYSRINIPLFLIYLMFYIIINTFLINNNGYESLKSTIILAIYIYTLYNYVKNYKEFDKLIGLLYNVSFFISIIGVIQELGYLFQKELLFNFSYIGVNNSITTSGLFMRVTSILTEPAHLAIFLLPGISIMVMSYLEIYDIQYKNRFKNCIILLCTFFTFSMIVYLTTSIVFIYFFMSSGGKNTKRISLIILILVIGSFILFRYNESLLIIKHKIESIFTLDKLDSNNLSSFAVVSNLKIAMSKIKDGYIFGTGFDSHAETYFKYIDSIYLGNSIVMYLNYQDASSIYIRILSEFGIFGFITYLIFIFKNLITSNMKRSKNFYLNYINKISLIAFVVYGIRMGTYINVYYILMFVTIIITSKKIKEEDNHG